MNNFFKSVSSASSIFNCMAIWTVFFKKKGGCSMSFAIEVSMYATSIFRNKIVIYARTRGSYMCVCVCVCVYIYISIFHLTHTKYLTQLTLVAGLGTATALTTAVSVTSQEVHLLSRRTSLRPHQTGDISDTSINFTSAAGASQTSTETVAL